MEKLFEANSLPYLQGGIGDATPEGERVLSLAFSIVTWGQHIGEACTSKHCYERSCENGCEAGSLITCFGPLREIRRQQRPAEKISLAFLASQVADDSSLLGRFDSLRDGPHS